MVNQKEMFQQLQEEDVKSIEGVGKENKAFFCIDNAGVSQHKCPCCKKKVKTVGVTRYSGKHIVNCKTNVYDVVCCPTCGMRIPYQSQKRAKVNRGVAAVAVGVVAVLGVVALFGGINLQGKDYQEGMDAYYQADYNSATQHFEESWLLNKDSTAMTVWCALQGLGQEQDIEKVQKRLWHAEKENPYTLATKAELALMEAQQLQEPEAKLEEAVTLYQECLERITQQEQKDERLLAELAQKLDGIQIKGASALEIEVFQSMDSLMEVQSSLQMQEWKEQEKELFAGLDGVARAQEEEQKWLADSAWRLGRCYWVGRGVTRADAQALALWGYAAKHGNADAAFQLAKLYQDGGKAYCCQVSIKKKEKRAYRYAQYAHQLGSSMGTALLGEYTYHGVGTEENKTEALQLLYNALEQREGYAAYVLGEIATETESKLDYYEKAYTEYGCVKGLTQFGLCQIKGRYGVVVNEDAGWNKLLRAAEQRDTQALMVCASDYYYKKYERKGDAEMLGKALEYFVAAAAQRDEYYSRVLKIAETKLDVDLSVG